jgi:TetR/AcrR family acrAB operon transcriptional repressor
MPTTEPSARRTQAERRRASERELLDAAALVIAEKGSARASLAEIATVAGRSHAHPHYLFGSKANLLQALVADFSDRFADEVVSRVEGSRGLDAITGIVTLFVRSLRRPWPMTRAFYVLLGESLSAAPELRPALAEYHRWLQRLIAGWIDEAVADGDVPATLDVDTAAAVTVATIRGIGFLALGDPDALDLRAVEAQTLRQLVHALRTPP